MSLKYNGLVAAFAIVLLAYWLYEPVFPDIEDVWLLRIVIAIKKVFKLLVSISQLLIVTISIIFKYRHVLKNFF